MNTELRKKYGLVTATAMVVGIVIGSGVFFKAEKILTATGGDLPLGILAWIIGGLIMVICSYTFSIMARKYEYVNGVVDYAEASVGNRYGYYVGWFMATIYYPTLTSVLAWVSARYTCVLIGFSITGGECMTIACLFLVASYALNALSPVLAGKFQVSSTVIKLIPLLLMAVAGTIVGLSSGMTAENFTSAVSSVNPGTALFTAVVATSFAYEGWVVATSINAELRDAKRNLPIALVAGSFIVVLVYIFYYVGLAGAVPNKVMMEGGQAGAKLAFETVFTKAGGTLIFVFVIISCLGTLNGLMLGCTRGMYALAARNAGPKPEAFSEVSKTTNMPTNSSILGLLLCGIWLFYFYGANLADTSFFGVLCFDPSELPIVTIYAAYIPIFIMLIARGRDLSVFKRWIMPVLSIFGCLFMIVAAVFSHRMAVVWYLIICAAFMAVGIPFAAKTKKLPGVN